MVREMPFRDRERSGSGVAYAAKLADLRNHNFKNLAYSTREAQSLS